MELKPCHRRPLRPDEIGPRVMELSKYLRKNFNAAVAEQGLFSGQQDILLLLIRQPGMTLGQLSRALGVASATASVSVKRMEKADLLKSGWTKRTPGLCGCIPLRWRRTRRKRFTKR